MGGTLIDFDHAAKLCGKTLTGSGDETLGTIDAVYADGPEGSLTFATLLQVGPSGVGTTFIPLVEATLTGETVTVPYSSELVKTAPTVNATGDLEPTEEERLYEHYGVDRIDQGARTSDVQSRFPRRGRSVGRERPLEDEDGMAPRGWDDGDRG
jgi:hypothetical protein